MLSEVQRILIQAAAARHPARALDELLAAALPEALTEAERTMLRGVDADGLALSGRIVRELRLERIVRGDPETGSAFEADPSGHSRRFAAWCDTRPEGHVFPADEARQWRTDFAGHEPDTA